MVIAVQAIANDEICLVRRETVPPFSLVQKRPLLKRTQGRSLTAQRSYGAISAHVFHNNLPIHDHQSFSPLWIRVVTFARQGFSIGYWGGGAGSNGFRNP